MNDPGTSSGTGTEYKEDEQKEGSGPSKESLHGRSIAAFASVVDMSKVER